MSLSKSILFGGAAASLAAAALWFGTDLLGNTQTKPKKKKGKKSVAFKAKSPNPKQKSVVEPSKEATPATKSSAASSSSAAASSSNPAAAKPIVTTDEILASRLLVTCTRLMGALHLLEEGKQAAARDAISPTDHALLEYVRKMDADNTKIKPRTRMLTVLFFMLFHTVNGAGRNIAIQLGLTRQDMLVGWQILEPSVRQLSQHSQQTQYHLCIMSLFLAQRLQSGEKLALVLDASLPHVLIGAVSPLLVPQLCCACAMLGRWADLHQIKTLLAAYNADILKQRYEDYNYLARISLVNLDLRSVCEAAEQLSYDQESHGDEADMNALWFSPKPSSLTWKHTHVRSMRIKGPNDEDFRSIPVQHLNQGHSLLVTGRVARTRNISNIAMVLHGPATPTRLDLAGCAIVRHSDPSDSDGHKLSSTRLDEDGNNDPHSDDDEVEAVAKMRALKGKRLLRRERLSLELSPNGSETVTTVTPGDAKPLLPRNKWVGTYVITHELLPENEVSIEDMLMKMLEAQEVAMAAAPESAPPSPRAASPASSSSFQPPSLSLNEDASAPNPAESAAAAAAVDSDAASAVVAPASAPAAPAAESNESASSSLSLSDAAPASTFTPVTIKISPAAEPDSSSFTASAPASSSTSSSVSLRGDRLAESMMRVMEEVAAKQQSPVVLRVESAIEIEFELFGNWKEDDTVSLFSADMQRFFTFLETDSAHAEAPTPDAPTTQPSTQSTPTVAPSATDSAGTPHATASSS